MQDTVSPTQGRPASFFGRIYAAARVHARDVRKQFLALVALPTALAGFYYGFVAADLYVSHVEYLVRGVNSHSTGGLGALLNTIGLSRAADDASAVESFVQSRGAVEKLNEVVNLREVYGLEDADFLARYPRFWELDTFERLYARMQGFIKISQDQTTGITTLEVPPRAYLMRTQEAIHVWDVFSGVLKSVFFAMEIGLIACFRGLDTAGGAEGVGRSTTSSVVTALFWLVLLDFAFTILFHAFGR